MFEGEVVEEDVVEDEVSLRSSCKRHFSTTQVMGATRHVARVMRRQWPNTSLSPSAKVQSIKMHELSSSSSLLWRRVKSVVVVVVEEDDDAEDEDDVMIAFPCLS